jgi:hypothetical protein
VSSTAQQILPADLAAVQTLWSDLLGPARAADDAEAITLRLAQLKRSLGRAWARGEPHA